MSEERFYIGIHGGHTRSIAFMLDKNFIIVGVVAGESLNTHTFPYEIVKSRLGDLLDGLANKANIRLTELYEKTIQVVSSMPGVAKESEQAVVKVCFHENGWRDMERICIVDDTWAGLIAGTFSYEGMCVYAGTGASIYVNEKTNKEPLFFGKSNKIDGWGPILGDFGSGFQLALNMCRFLCREYDKGKTPKLFYKLLEQDGTIKNLSQILQWFDGLHIIYPQDWRIRFAYLAKVATLAADASKPDPSAEMLVKRAANEIIASIKIAFQRFPKANTLPVVFHGGMFEYSYLYRELVGEAVKKMTSGDVYLSYFRPVVGTMLLALAKSKQLSDNSAIKNIYNAVNKLPEGERNFLIQEKGHTPFDKENLNIEQI